MESGYKLGLLRIFRGKNYEEKSVFQNCILPLPLFVSFVRAARLSRALSHSFHSFSTTDFISVKLDLPACLPLGLTSFTTRTVLTSVKTSVGSGTVKLIKTKRTRRDTEYNASVTIALLRSSLDASASR